MKINYIHLIMQRREKVENKLWRVGTTYIPVSNVEKSCEWYEQKLRAVVNYRDEEKAILDMANQSFFLVQAEEGETANFVDGKGETRFSITFEVDGEKQLEELRKTFLQHGVKVGEIESRGHSGKNFVFEDLDGNKFDVWSELSTVFKEKYFIVD